MAKSKKRTSNKNRRILPMKPLIQIEKEVFNGYRRQVGLIDEDLVINTLNKLEEVDKVTNLYIEKAAEEVISYLELAFTNDMNNSNEVMNRLGTYMEKVSILDKLDEFYKKQLTSCKRDIDIFTNEHGYENQRKIELLRPQIEIMNSENLVNHVTIFLNNYHSNSVRLLNHLIKETFEALKMQSIEWLNKSNIVFFGKLGIITKDYPEFHNAFNKIQEILSDSEINQKEIVYILKNLDTLDLEETFKVKELINNSMARDNSEEQELKKYQKEKHYDFKELEKIALDNGYILDRVNGDHFIYRNDKKKHSIPIPNRTIGKGLSIAIKKEILKK